MDLKGNKHKQKEKHMQLNLDHKRFWPSVAILVAVCLSLLFNLEAVQQQVSNIYNGVINYFGWLFIVVDTLCLILSLYFIFGKYSKVRLGGLNAKPEYSTLSWAAMIFTSSCGAWLIVYGFLEPIYILSSPPFQLVPQSPQAYEFSQLYAHFHWGPSAWCIYVPITIAIGYQIYNRRQKSNSLSVACRPALGKFQKKWFIGLIDFIAIFGAIVSPVISIGTGMPVLTALIQDFLGLAPGSENSIQIGILIVWAIIFITSVFLGVKHGIKNFSNLNTSVGFGFMVVVGLFAGLVYVIEAETNVIGMMISNFPRMQSYTDPYGGGAFVKGWTASYWGCYLVYMPMMGVFAAKISKGRTLREISIALLVLCTLGCWISMGTFGNFALELQKNGTVDVVSILANQGEAAAVVAIVQQMPFAKIMMGILIAICIIFLCTTMDSSTISVAEMTTKHRDGENHAPRMARIVWAAAACMLTFVLLKIGGYKSIRLMCLIMGLPLGILAFFVMASCLKMLKKDFKQPPKNPT